MAEEVFNDGELIDESGFQRLARQVEYAKDRLVKVVFKNNKGKETKRINSMSGKRLQVVGGVIELDDRKNNDQAISINVNFATPFSGKHPAVVAIPETPGVAFGLSVSNVTQEGFTLNIRKFSDSNEWRLRAVHYVAVGHP